MVVDVKEGTIEHHIFRDLPCFLRPGDAVALNETKVLPARLSVRRPGGGASELLFLRELKDGAWEALARPSRRLRRGMVLCVKGRAEGDGLIEVVEPLGEGRWAVTGEDVPGTLRRHGRAPLPPYIEATREAEKAYQTVYARNMGSAAAPTAGLHFSQEVLEGTEHAGARLARLTLHVGMATFSPVRVKRLEDHRMHPERYSIPGETARVLGHAERVIAVGTTVARALESWVRSGRQEGETELFIHPGYKWGAVDALVTNFHLPRSTLIAMVMAFAGKDLVRKAYETAVEERYRFFSFGDAMLLLNGGRTRSP
jgi:S-adenosylmethionine:tRNA ribosyltransferase-isomerase